MIENLIEKLASIFKLIPNNSKFSSIFYTENRYKLEKVF